MHNFLEFSELAAAKTLGPLSKWHKQDGFG